jgi:hypothetical protein
MTKLKSQFASLPQAQWSNNLYWGWLYALKTLIGPAPSGYPTFMQNTAWTDKNLNSFLGSWTELRHDTILYAKQPIAVTSSVMLPPAQNNPTSYLEPNPSLYSRLLALTQQTQAGLQARQLLNPELKTKLTDFQTLLQRFVTISQQELSNQNLSADDTSYLLGFGSIMQQLTTFSNDVDQKVSNAADDKQEIVADVATDPNKQQVQEEAIGAVLPMYVLVPVNGQLHLLQGGVFSYYEFQQPLANRLTDEAWQQQKPRPALPSWVNSFVK